MQGIFFGTCENPHELRVFRKPMH